MKRPYVLGSVGPCTLREELNRRGYTDHPSDRFQRREIRRGAKVVAALDAENAWSWLARRDSKLRTLGASEVLSPDTSGLSGE